MTMTEVLQLRPRTLSQPEGPPAVAEGDHTYTEHLRLRLLYPSFPLQLYELLPPRCQAT